MRLRELWGRLFRANYTSALERDVARLRAENRALLNSILGIAGVPPIVVTADDPGVLATVNSGVKKAAPGLRAGIETESGAGRSATVKNASAANASAMRKSISNERGLKSVATPMRRRSWHQIYRMLEIDAARKKESA
jgi:hypothetical protein